MIRYLRHHQIEKKRWDAAIEHSRGRVVYALSWYLDTVSPGWCALVKDDYEVLMPLPVKRKFGVRMITQPYLCQQLGLFSGRDLQAGELEEFLGHIPGVYPVVRLSFNVSNNFLSGKALVERKTYILDLGQAYDKLRAGYSNDAARNLKKARKNSIAVSKIDALDELWAFAGEYPRAFDAVMIKKVFEELYERGLLVVYGGYHEGQLVSISVFARSFDSYIYLFSATTNVGRKASANYLLMDTFINEHASQPLLLDFEGSSIRSIAKFFGGFCASPVSFMHLRFFNVLCDRHRPFTRF